MADPELPSFDLVVATVDRVDELGRLLDSLERQSHDRFRVLVVDQNADNRLDAVLARHDTLDVMHLRSDRGLSRARNEALRHLRADLVAFPDDDCTYAPGLLERVSRRFADEPRLDGITGRAVDAAGRSASSWRTDASALTTSNLWNRAISFTIFLRHAIVGRVGSFDEQLGLGAATPWSSAEEIDFLVRALGAGARIEYDPQLVVTHAEKRLESSELRAIGMRDGASVGYLLRKHRYPPRTVARMLVRPAGGAVAAAARGDRRQARLRIGTFLGRVRGYLAASGQ